MKIEIKLNLISIFSEMGELFAIMLLSLFTGLTVASIFDLNDVNFYFLWFISTVFLVVVSTLLRNRMVSKEIFEQLPNDFSQYLLDKTSEPIDYVNLGELWDEFCSEKNRKLREQEQYNALSEQKKNYRITIK